MAAPAPTEPRGSSIERAYPIIERLVGGVAGLMLGGVVASLAGYLVGFRDVTAGSFTFLGSVVGATWGAVRPPRIGRGTLAPLPSVTPGAPVPIGALGAAATRALERPTAGALVAGIVVGLIPIPAVLAVYLAAETRPSLVVVGLSGTAGFVVAMACMAFLPGVLLPRRTRSALAAHLWLGAREFERALGSRLAVDGFPLEQHAIEAWLASHPETDATRELRVELHLMAGEVQRARETIGRIDATTPRLRFTRSMLEAMADYQETGRVDLAAAEAALEAMPAGSDKLEARVALATFDARRQLDGGDWRVPLLAVRSAIPERDARILARDLGWVSFTMLLRRTRVVVAVLLLMTFALGVPIDLLGDRDGI